MLWERVESEVFEVRETGNEIHHVVLGTWWVYEFQGPYLLCQVSEIFFEDGEEWGWIEVMECERG